MTDLEISRALARAIGWKDSRHDPDVVTVIPMCGGGYVSVRFNGWWTDFDYRDWGVIGPIAEKYKSFPKNVGISWISWFNQCSYCTVADTPQKAIALAVIEGAKK